MIANPIDGVSFPGKGRYSKYYFLNNRLAGVIMIGDLSDMVKITEALEKHALYKDVLG